MKWSLAEIEIGRDGKEYQWVADNSGRRFILLKKEKAENIVRKHNSLF